MSGVLFIDYETYYDDLFSLSRKDITTVEYVRDPRFKVHGAAVSLDGAQDTWVTGRDLPDYFASVRGKYSSMCCFNGPFDHAITALYYDPEEHFLLDPMSMAKAVFSAQIPDMRFSLDKLARFAFPDRPDLWKMEEVLAMTKGVRDLPPWMENQLGIYACQDNKVQRELFRWLLGWDYPWATGLVDLHLTLAMGVYPVLRMNQLKAAGIHDAEVKAKDAAVAALQVDRKDLRSGDKFAALLEDAGAVVPYKENDKGELIYAFAKSDPGMKELLEHSNPRVQALAEARIGEKSSQRESRSAKFARAPNPLPIPLAFAAAHTGRHGGTDGYNFQNLERGGALRGCITAGKGYKILVHDLAQIELRMSAWWCGEQWLLNLLDAGGDPYCRLATLIYGRTITEADEDERYVGKQGELSCGYQAGDERVLGMLKAKGVTWATPALAKKVKTSFRNSHLAIVGTWEWLQKKALPVVAGYGEPFEYKGVWFEQGSVRLPSGRRLWYPDLHVNEHGDWVYRVSKSRNNGAEWKKIFGGAFLENIVQALSYDVFMFHAREAYAQGQRLAMAVHDEMVFRVPEETVAEVSKLIGRIQTMAPAWCAGVPLKGKGSYGDTYLEAK